MASCGSDEFSVSGEGPEAGGAAVTASGGASSSGGTRSEASGGTSSSSTGGSAPATGGETSGFQWEGERDGPTMADVDPTMGGFNQDLPAPEPCEDLPESGCLHFSGIINGGAVSGSCDPAGFSLDGAVLTCTGEGFSFTFSLAAFTGAPPSKFNFTADSGQHPIGMSWDAAAFASHAGTTYLIDATHEQNGVRAVGVRYQLLQSDSSTEPFVTMAFAFYFIPRPTCPTCATVRIRGVMSAYTGSPG